MLSISEIFLSLQGEGPMIGYPALFIRFAGCPAPHCSWCDTPYAQEITAGRVLKPEQIFAEIEALLRKTKGWQTLPLLVLTGGEPFAYWSEEKSNFVTKLSEFGFSIQWESSGRVPIPSGIPGSVVCSPKFFDGTWRFVPENEDRIDAYKFVVTSKEDMPEIVAFLALYPGRNTPAYLMPEGSDKISQEKRGPMVAALALQYGLRYSTRLHILLENLDRQGHQK